MSKCGVSLQIFGSQVTEEAGIQASDAIVGLLHAVQQSIAPGTKPIGWQRTIHWICDGCECERPTAELPAGWVNADRLDYCLSCVANRDAP